MSTQVSADQHQASAEKWLNTLPPSLYHQDLHLPPDQDVLQHYQDDQVRGTRWLGVEADQDQVNLPKRSQTVDYLLTAALEPQLLSCDCARSEPVTTIGTTSQSCLLPGHVGHQDAGGGGGLLGEGDEGDTHDSLERKAKQITSVSLEAVFCSRYLFIYV